MAKYRREDLVTEKVEVSWKKHDKSFKGTPHYHKIGIDINIIISGHVTAVIAGKSYDLYPN